MRYTKKINILAIAALTVCAATASAQKTEDDGLKKAIVIEKDFVPVETKAVKPDVLPEEAAVVTRPVNLSFSDWAIPATVTPILQRQSPIRYDDANMQPFRRRGYANFGMGNYLNISGNAGYRIIDKERTALGVWLQHNSTNGSIDGLLPLPASPVHSGGMLSDGNEYLPGYNKQFFIDDKIGVDFATYLNRGKLEASARYGFSKFNYYGTPFVRPGDDKQKTNAFNVGLLWRNNDESSVRYYAGASFDYLGYGFGYWDTKRDLTYIDLPLVSEDELKGLISGHNPGLKEYHGNVVGGAEFLFGDNSYIGMDGRFQILNYDNPQAAVYEPFQGGYVPNLGYYDVIQRVPSKSFGMLSLTPYYSKRTDNLNLRIGARLDISFSNGTVFRIAPDVKLDWKLSDKVGLQVSATGGNYINTFHELSAENRYVNPSLLLPTTYTLVDAQAGLSFGLWQGLSMTPFVGFAVTKDNMIPVVSHDLMYALYLPESSILAPAAQVSQTVFKGVDMNGVIAGIKFGYKIKDLVDIKAKYAFTPQGLKSGYVLSYDRPEHSLDASVKVTPIKRLDIVLSYQLHALREYRRDYLGETLDENNNLKYVPNSESIRLSNLSNLNLGATYRINDMIHVYCQANNLLNRRYENYYGLFAQKFNIMGGIGVNF